MLKQCSECGTEFETRHKTLSCSEICKKKKLDRTSRAWAKANPDKVRLHRKSTRTKSKPKRALYRKARHKTVAGYIDGFLYRIKIATPDTDIDREFLKRICGEVCAISKVPFKFDRQGGTSFTNPYAPSVDRIDSSRGYYKDNVHCVLVAINFAKNQMSMESFLSVWADVISYGALMQCEKTETTTSPIVAIETSLISPNDQRHSSLSARNFTL